ncbi:hypothetical protein [Roseateles asaccharophilus]|uniref:ABC-type branched-subunit amino acid transport system substrate-binding protein n=1 Tax=Roseateles asaccharophilus TaxID=582607 RepID=A0ABU2AD26_9BURK|nr:hypothetical protein [Roseateles asaccharophilus]MDR7335107.1 ABC-type branched-subunit amino acid transport system substrate-binding protein [Roseateles asaccharophilus]
MTAFISVRVRNALVLHGYTDDNQEVVETFSDQPFVEKLLAVSRLQSVSEQYLLVTSSHGRVMYWEYEGSLADIRARLQAAGVSVG